jgi:hypothetical protein
LLELGLKGGIKIDFEGAAFSQDVRCFPDGLLVNEMAATGRELAPDEELCPCLKIGLFVRAHANEPRPYGAELAIR